MSQQQCCSLGAGPVTSALPVCCSTAELQKDRGLGWRLRGRGLEATITLTQTEGWRVQTAVLSGSDDAATHLSACFNDISDYSNSIQLTTQKLNSKQFG